MILNKNWENKTFNKVYGNNKFLNDIPKSSALSKLNNVTSYEAADKLIVDIKDRRKRNYKKAKDAIIKSIYRTLDDYIKIRDKFDVANFDISIKFAIGNDSKLSGSFFDLISLEGGMGKSYSHSLKLSFVKTQ